MASTSGAGRRTRPKSIPSSSKRPSEGSDDQNSLKVGDRGPVLLEDFALREKIFHFDHERIPERVVTAADVFARPDEQTPV